MVRPRASSEGNAEIDSSERDEALEGWLRTEVAAAYDELKADPSRGRTPDQVRQRLADERRRRDSQTR